MGHWHWWFNSSEVGAEFICESVEWKQKFAREIVGQNSGGCVYEDDGSDYDNEHIRIRAIKYDMI